MLVRNPLARASAPARLPAIARGETGPHQLNSSLDRSFDGRQCVSEETHMLKRLASGIGLVAVAALGAAAPACRNAHVDALRIAVFRQQAAFWLDKYSPSQTVVCLSIEDGGVRRSVSKEYLGHFPSEAAVRTGDACDEQASGAVERGTGRPAVLVAVGAIAWQSSGVRTQRVVREKTGWVCLGQIIKDTPL
jgi:hypothetical protein